MSTTAQDAQAREPTERLGAETGRDVEIFGRVYRVNPQGRVYVRVFGGGRTWFTPASNLRADGIAAVRCVAELEEERERRVESVLLEVLSRCQWSYEDDDALRISFPRGFVLPPASDDDLMTISNADMARAFAEAFNANLP